ELRQTLERANGRICRSGEALVQADLGASSVEQDEIGECAANVETETITRGHESLQASTAIWPARSGRVWPPRRVLATIRRGNHLNPGKREGFALRTHSTEFSSFSPPKKNATLSSFCVCGV